MATRQVNGSFGSYVLEGKDSYPPDEEATSSAIEVALSMCGNAGQEAMVMEIADQFFDWALEVLEDESAVEGSSWEDFQILLLDWYENRTDKVKGTVDIWGQAWVIIADQSGYHDSYDEMGEGTGREF